MIDRGSGAALLREREKKLEARRIRFVQNLDMVQGLCYDMPCSWRYARESTQSR